MFLQFFFHALYIIKTTPASDELPYTYFFSKSLSSHCVMFSLTFCPTTSAFHLSGSLNEVSLQIFMPDTFLFFFFFFKRWLKSRVSPDVFCHCQRRNSNLALDVSNLVDPYMKDATPDISSQECLAAEWAETHPRAPSTLFCSCLGNMLQNICL